MDFLRNESVQHPRLTSHYLMFSDLFDQRLYHQLTEALLVFLADKNNSIEDNFLLVNSFEIYSINIYSFTS